METEVGQQHGDHGIDELVGHKQMFAIAGTQSHTPFVEKQLLRLVDHPSVAGLVAFSLHLLISPHEHLMSYNSKGIIPSYNNSSSIDTLATIFSEQTRKSPNETARHRYQMQNWG